MELLTIQSLKEDAYARLADVPAGTNKEDYLPFVEQFEYWRDYERLTGKKWEA